MLEDQQKINKFARLNSRWEELREETKARRGEIQTLEDASTDLMMLEDDEEKVPYQVGEVFVLMTQEEAQQAVEKRKTELEAEVSGEGGCCRCRGTLALTSVIGVRGLAQDGLAEGTDVRPQDAPVRQVRLGHQPGGRRGLGGQ